MARRSSSPTDDDVLRDEVDVYGLRVHVRFDLLTGKVKPFLVVGAGAHVVRGDSPQMVNDTDRLPARVSAAYDTWKPASPAGDAA